MYTSNDLRKWIRLMRSGHGVKYIQNDCGFCDRDQETPPPGRRNATTPPNLTQCVINFVNVNRPTCSSGSISANTALREYKEMYELIAAEP